MTQLFTDAELEMEIIPKGMPTWYILMAYYAPESRWAMKGHGENRDELAKTVLASGWSHKRIYRIKGDHL